MTHSNTFNLIEDLWTSNFLMDVGGSRTKVDARTYLLKQVAAYRPPQPSGAITLVHKGPQRLTPGPRGVSIS